MSLVPFLLAAVLLAITPGPGLAYVIARTASGGRAEGLASSLGTALGGLVHVAAAALGLSLLIAQSALAFGLLKWIGAAYLIWLGVQMLRRDATASDPLEPLPRQGARRALLDGIAVETLNVKTALFFLAFLPQFTTPAEPLAPQLVLLGCVCVLLNTSMDVFAVLMTHRLLRSGPARAARERWIRRISGTTMLGLGAFLALARREV